MQILYFLDEIIAEVETPEFFVLFERRNGPYALVGEFDFKYAIVIVFGSRVYDCLAIHLYLNYTTKTSGASFPSKLSRES